MKTYEQVLEKVELALAKGDYPLCLIKEMIRLWAKEIQCNNDTHL